MQSVASCLRTVLLGGDENQMQRRPRAPPDPKWKESKGKQETNVSKIIRDEKFAQINLLFKNYF